jgi:hypothetical protein
MDDGDWVPTDTDSLEVPVVVTVRDPVLLPVLPLDVVHDPLLELYWVAMTVKFDVAVTPDVVASDTVNW